MLLYSTLSEEIIFFGQFLCYLPEILTLKSDSNADVMLEKRWIIVVSKAKDKYEAALDELNRLMQKREEARRKELMECLYEEQQDLR